MEGEKDMSETKKRNMRTRKEKTVARKAEVPKAEATTAGIAFGTSDGGITTGVSNGISVGAYDSITTGISNGSAVGISDGMVADITRGISVGASDGIPDVIATSASEGISDGTSAGVSATIGASVPSAIPAGVPAAVNQTCGKGLKELTAEWMQLERKTLEQRKDAARFYDEHLMKPIEDEFVRNNQDMVFEDVEYMVISVGTSYEPIVLDIQLLKPAKILFLYTETSQDTMAKVIGYCGLSPNRYDKSLVSEVDPMDTYREIKSFYLRSGKPGKMYIDFTGGTKAMSAAATLAGAMIDVQMVYCSTDDYLVDFRKPNPGSERLIYIENPLAVFGELEIEKAFELFDKKNFAGAKEKFSVLKENLPDPALRQQLGFVCLLATAYEAWDALDFVPAYESMQRLQKEIERDRKLHRDYLLMDCSMHIDRQRAMLENLRKIPQFQEERNMKGILEDPGILHALALTLYQNARTREMQEKYDMATLLLYRLLEMMSQRRLIRYGIFASRPDYHQLKFNLGKYGDLKKLSQDERLGWLTERYRNISATVFRREPDRYLPSPIASLDGFILLAALGDPMVGNGKLSEAVIQIKRIRSMVYLRNNSIFAHGLGPVAHKDYFKFRAFVFEMFRSFCKIEKMDLDEAEKYAAWINPMNSENYARAIR
jgi:CRISPR-associated protein (TIGR02710 family)